MKTELHTLLKTRGIKLPGKDEIAELQDLESRWQALKARESNVMPLRVAEHQEAAHSAFMADPSIENEMQVAILTDTALTLCRYAARRKVIANYMKLLASEAGKLLMPFCEQASAALDEEMAVRKAQKSEVIDHQATGFVTKDAVHASDGLHESVNDTKRERRRSACSSASRPCA